MTTDNQAGFDLAPQAAGVRLYRLGGAGCRSLRDVPEIVDPAQLVEVAGALRDLVTRLA